MKNFIKVLSALFSTTLAINCIFSISLLNTNAASLNEKKSEFEYAEKAVSTYLQSYKVNNDEIYISDSLDVYDTKHVWWLSYWEYILD